MKREIKFRVWDKMASDMIINSTRTISMTMGFDYGNPFFELLQYTGLKDKNGIEIYESDIVKVVDYGIAKIIFIQGSFMCEWLDDEAYSEPMANIIWNDHTKHENMFEVIGNIYENKELLNER